jgi:hypothetical protein
VWGEQEMGLLLLDLIRGLRSQPMEEILDVYEGVDLVMPAGAPARQEPKQFARFGCAHLTPPHPVRRSTTVTLCP